MKIILTCCLVLLSAPLFAGGLPAKPHITVSGLGVIRVVPDILTIHLSVEKLGQRIDRAKQDVDRRTSDAIDVAKRIGIDKRDITSTQIIITPRYDYHNDKQQLVGYEVRREIALTLRNLDKYEPLLKGLVGAGVNNISGITRRYSHPEALRDQAFAKAVDDARAKAARLAHEFHSELGDVYAITEQSSPEPRPLMQRRTQFAAAAKASAFEPGTIDVEARIQVVFLLKHQ